MKKPLPKKGLVIGKFYPPHKGHHMLIDTALNNSDSVDVLVCDSPDYRIPAVTRAAWLRHRHPNANVRIIPDIGKDDDSAAWAKYTKDFLGYTPDVVFSSEDYGDEYARLMNATHVKVDRERKIVPVSGTKVRRNVQHEWEFLEPHVRAEYCKRVCVLGAESTGTTTLSQALAKHYKTLWVPEFGRHYSEMRQHTDLPWETEDFVFIAEQQQRLEDKLAGQTSNGLLICDTDTFATQLWHERYMGEMTDALNHIADRNKIGLYILTDVDIPFVDDGLRDGEHIRHAMHQRFIEELDRAKVPYILVSGSVQERLDQAIPVINEFKSRKVTI